MYTCSAKANDSESRHICYGSYPKGLDHQHGIAIFLVGNELTLDTASSTLVLRPVKFPAQQAVC